jgi:hypothetical protein
MRQSRMMVGSNDRCEPRLHSGSRGPVSILRTVVVRETQEVKRTTCWSGSSPAECTLIQIATTLSDMSDRLSLLSSRSISCFIGWMVQRMIMIVFIMIITVLLQ